MCGGQVEVFVEPLLPAATLVVVGAGHVGKAVAHLAKWLQFRVVVSDDREEFCNREAVPDADEFIVCPMKDLPDRLRFDTRTYVVLTTRGSSVDVAGLPALLRVPSGLHRGDRFETALGDHREGTGGGRSNARAACPRALADGT